MASKNSIIAAGADGWMFRNRVINGDFRIDQRYEGTSIVTGAGSGYTMDRWLMQTTQASKITVAQFSGFNSTNYGIPFNTGINVTMSGTAYTPVSGDYFQLQQPIEAINTQDFMWGTPFAKPVVLSFYCATNNPGTYAGRISSGGSSTNYSYVFTFNATGAATYVSIPIPGCSSGTPYTLAGVSSIAVTFDFGGGSNRSTSTPNTWVSGDYSTTPSALKFVSIANNTMYITGVQLELGTISSPFETRPLSTEYSLCQRYFEKSYSRGQAPGTTADSYNNASLFYLNGQTSQQYSVCFQWFYKVTKMTSATLTLYSHATGTSGMARDMNSNADVTANAQMQGSCGGASVAAMSKASGTIYMGQAWTATAEL